MIWYGHHHLCLWSPSSKHRHDHHCHRRDTLIFIVASLSFRHLLLLRLSLPLSDKVKQLQGVCISYNKATTIWLLPVADNFGYKTWSSHTIKFSIMSWPYHITTCPAKTSSTSSTLLLQVLRGCYGMSKNRSYLRIKTTMIVRQVGAILTFSRTGRSHTRFS